MKRIPFSQMGILILSHFPQKNFITIITINTYIHIQNNAEAMRERL